MMKSVLMMLIFGSVGFAFVGFAPAIEAHPNGDGQASGVAQEEASSREKVSPTDVFGKWRTPDKALIDIQPCGESVCGTLLWFTELENAQEPILDTLNKDEELQSRELKGISLIYGFERKTKGWRKGKIYDPGSGTLYKSKLTRLDATSLKVEGCVGPICKKFIWTREGI